MARKRPHDPAAAVQAALERKARDAEAERLEAQGATVRRDRAGHIISAYRSNVFNLLLTRGTITQGHHDAAADLCELWAVWKGLDGKADNGGEFVDNGRTPPDRRCLVSDRQIRAGKDLYGDERRVGIMNTLAPHHRKLLEAYMVATVEEDRPMEWRGIVEATVGIASRDKQVNIVVGSLEELRIILQEPRERAA